jgi:hypothetical protein
MGCPKSVPLTRSATEPTVGPDPLIAFAVQSERELYEVFISDFLPRHNGFEEQMQTSHFALNPECQTPSRPILLRVETPEPLTYVLSARPK